MFDRVELDEDDVKDKQEDNIEVEDIEDQDEEEERRFVHIQPDIHPLNTCLINMIS